MTGGSGASERRAAAAATSSQSNAAATSTTTTTKPDSSALVRPRPPRPPPPLSDALSYATFYIAGLAVLAPWNALITCSDVWEAYFPGKNVPRLLTACYLPVTLLFMGLLLLLSHERTFPRARAVGGLAVFAVLVAAVPAWDAVAASRGGGDAVGAPARGTIPASALLAIAVLIGVVDGLAQPAVYGEAALLPSKFTQAVCAGTAASGALTSLIRIITKAAFDNGDKSSAAGGTKALTAFFGTSAVECAAAAVLFACVLPRTRAARSLAAGHAEARASLLKGSQVIFFLNFRAEVESSVDGKPHSSTLKALSLSLHCLSLLFRFVFLLFRNETLHRPRARWRCRRWCPPRRRRRKKRQQQQQQQQQQQHQQQQRKKRSLKKTPPPTPPPRRRPKGSPRPPATPLPRAGASRATCGPAPRPWSRSTG